MFKIIFISILHITDREWNITRKVWQSCYKKYRFHRCSGNIGITNCTTATVTKISQAG